MDRNEHRPPPRALLNIKQSRSPAQNLLRGYLVFTMVVLLGTNINLGPGVTTSLVISIVSIPFWARFSFASSWARSWLILWTALLLWGAFLAASGWVLVDPQGASAMLRFVLSAVIVVFPLLRSIRLYGLRTVFIAYAIGMVVGALVEAHGLDPSAWKYLLSYPVTILAFSVIYERGMVANAASALLLAGVGIASNARSYMAFCIVTALFIAIAVLVRWMAHGRGRVVLGSAVIFGAGIGIFQILVNLLIEGYFGTSLQEISLDQQQTSGSLLAGGRPEWYASFGLMQFRPWGYAPGAVPSFEDLQAARKGLSTINISGLSDYYQDYMFGGHFKLHSIIADLWVNFGLPGLAVGAGLAIFIGVRFVYETFGRERPAGLTIFVAASALWALFFAPILSNFFELSLTYVLLAALSFRNKATVRASGQMQPSLDPALHPSIWKGMGT